MDLEQKIISKEREKHEYSLEYNEILRSQKLAPPPSEKGAQEIIVELVEEDADEDLTPLDELGEKGGPPPEPLPTQVDRSTFGPVKRKAITSRPQFVDLGRLGSSRFSPYEAGRLRSWSKE